MKNLRWYRVTKYESVPLFKVRTRSRKLARTLAGGYAVLVGVGALFATISRLVPW
jgi:hypothetical protein